MTGVRLVEVAAVVPRLIPSAVQVQEFLAFLVVALGFVVIGAALRTLARPRSPLLSSPALPEADLLVGWSASLTLFIIAGTVTDIPFTWLADIMGAGALAAGVYLRRTNTPVLAPGMAKMLVLLLPILLVTLSQGPSENDDLAQWLPNLRYLILVDHFPAPGRPISDSVFPSYPYATALVGYLTGKITGSIPVTAVDRFNLLVLASLALLVRRLFTKDNNPAAPGWRACALALTAATLLSPTFVPRLVLSNYVDCATAVAFAFSTVMMVRLTDADTPPSRAAILQTMFVAIALLMAKQANLVLLAAAVGSIVILRLRRPALLVRLIPVLAGTAIAYLAWRHQVAMLGGGEMPIARFSEWQWDILPITLSNMLHVAVNKGGYFGLALILSAVAIVQRKSAPLAVTFALTFWGFTLFLTWVYLAVYIGYEGRSAASFWRYHTQLGGLELAALAVLTGTLWQQHKNRFPGQSAPVAGIVALIVIAAGPVLAAQHLRFDVNPSKDHVQDAVQAMAPLLPDDARLMVADPKGSGFFTAFVRWNLGFHAPVKGDISIFMKNADILASLNAAKISHVYVISSTPELQTALGQDIPTKGTSLFARTADNTWTQIAFWPFDGFDSIEDFKY